jgi:hypothetical protein
LNEKALQEILGLLSIGATTAAAVAGGGDVAAGATVASSLIAIAQKAISAHQAVTGQPIDPSLLKPFVPD